MSEHRTTLLKRMRFGGDALRQLLDGLSDNDRDMVRSALDACNDGSVQKKRGVKVEMKKLETCPQLALLRYDEDGQLQCGIYIFIEEAIKLTRHLNATFSFSTSECLLFTFDITLLIVDGISP